MVVGMGMRRALSAFGFSGLVSASCVLMGPVLPAAAGGAHSLTIIDANTGATLADQDGGEPRYPASLTKMMTLYLAFDAIDSGRATLKSKIKFSQQAVNAAPSKLGLEVGDELGLEEAILALITKSANDVAIAVAEHLGGTEANFAKLMTAKAREIGMKATTFKNASGLPDSGQTTTARDMVTLGLRLHDDHPKYFLLFATKTFAFNGGSFKNHNTLMLQMPGINGIKTGYTHASGFNLVSSYQQDGKHLVGAIFGGETAGLRNAHMRVALTRALAKASTVKTRRPVLVARASQPVKAEGPRKPRVVAAPVHVASAAPVAPVAPVAPPIQQAATIPETAPIPKAEPVVEAEAAPAPTRAPLRIDVAKVRSVSAAPAMTAAPGAAPPTFVQANAAPRLTERVTSPPAAALTPVPVAAAVQVPVQAEGALRAPSQFERQMASLAQNIAPAPQPSPPVAASAPAPVVRPPSSLNAQMAALIQPTLTQPPPTGATGPRMADPSYRLKGPDAATAPPATGRGFEIQIGAYATAAEADRRLAATQGQIALLRGKKTLRQTVTLGEKTLHRARFGGFDQASAQAACAELQKQALNCLVLKAE